MIWITSDLTLSLQGDERSALSVAMWLVTTFTTEEVKR